MIDPKHLDVSKPADERLCPECFVVFSADMRTCPQDGSRLLAVGNDPHIGTTVAQRYRVDKLIGFGQSGLVYQAFDLKLNRDVAIKMLKEQLSKIPAVVKRFQREANVISSLNHPNVATLFDFGESERQQFYLVMELIKGSPLSAVLKTRRRLSTKTTLDLFIPVLDALSTAHRQGIIIRDIKPADLVLTENSERLKLVDLGLAKRLESEQEHITATGDVVTTSEYASPEVLLGGSVDHRADIWSIGFIMYECVTGIKPVTTGALSSTDSTSIVVKRRCLDQEVPEALAAVLSRAASRYPNRRFQSMSAFKEKLEDVRSKVPADDQTPSTVAERKRGLPLVAIVIVLLVVAILCCIGASISVLIENKSAPQHLHH